MNLLLILRQVVEEKIPFRLRYLFKSKKDLATVGTVSASSPEPQVQIQMNPVLSANFRTPLLHLVEDPDASITNYTEKCVPLQKAAINGNFRDVSHFFEEDPLLIKSAITKEWATTLHVAAGANNVRFVKDLANIMEKPEYLELQDYNGNTAFFFAAAAGNVTMAKIMLEKNKSLPTIRGNESVTPLHLALMQGKSEMATFLYPLTYEVLEEKDFIRLFLICVNHDIYDFASKMLEDKPTLAYARDDEVSPETALHVLARKRPMDSRTKNQVLELVKSLWTTILCKVQNKRRIEEIISTPSHLIFIAARVGNFEFLAELMSSFPDLMWTVDIDNQTIIHFAVLHRHANIFNLIREIGSFKDLIVSNADPHHNNLLHCAAKIAPSEQLNLVSGAAFQLMLELLWFEEVKKIVPPAYIERKNLNDLTPRELFSKEHENLLGKAEEWMKSTANSCMLVSTVIATGVFSALFSLPGGNDDESGNPHYLKKLAFKIFVISDGTAVISSSTATLIFLSVLISRYAEDDFRKSLPRKLISGLLMLFISITSMMGALGSALFITYYHDLKWVPSVISVLAFLPIPLFVFLQFKLWSDILYSTYYCRSLFRPRRRIIS